MQTFLRDLRYALRTLMKKPGFTAIAVLTLALGIGANSAIFSVVNGVLLRSLPYPVSERVMMIGEASTTNQLPGRSFLVVSHRNFTDWRDRNHSFKFLSAYTGRWGGPSTILGGSEPTRGFVVGVYRNFFETLGTSPAFGRAFTPEESDYGTAPVAVVSYKFWQRNLSADPNLDKQKLTIEGHTFSVIGVMPPEFNVPDATDVWMSREQLVNDDGSARSSHNFVGIGRLKDGVSLEQARAEMTAIAHQIAEEDSSDSPHDNVVVIPLKEQLTGTIRPALLVLVAAVGLVLLIACANVANLLLARAAGRQKEIAIRTAVGASRAHIVRQLLTESLLLALAGGVLGMGLAYYFVRVLLALSPTTIPRLNEITLDSNTFAFTLVISLLTSLLFGMVPALRASNPNLNEVLKEGGRSTSGGSGFARSALIVTEVALTLILLIGAGLLVKSLWRVLQVSPGFNPDRVLTMQLSLPESGYDNAAKKIGFYRQLFERLKALPEIDSAGMVNDLPMGGIDINGAFGIAGRPLDKGGFASYRIVSPEYFRALNIPLIKGRYFTEQDAESSEPVALISQSVAKTVFENEDPLGQHVASTNDLASKEELNHPEKWAKIVGVVGDVKHFGLEGRDSTDLYVCYTQRPRRIGDMTVVVRAKGGQNDLAAGLRQAVNSLDKNLPVKFEPMDEVVARSTANRRYTVILLAAFAGLAVLLASVGIYGVMSYAVSQSTREIGIRMALGARAVDVLGLVIRQGMALAAVGVVIGLAGAFGLTRLMAGLLFGVTATDALTFAAVPTLLLTVALLACFVPARRATKVDPMIALRYE